MALILTLVILTILSILLVSFVSMTSLDRGATKSYTQSLQAEQLALGGLAQLVSQLQTEVAVTSTNYSVSTGSGTNNLYIPLTGSNAVPQRTAPNLSNLATLLSFSGIKLYTGAVDYSSPSSTQTKSLNGRYISTARWNKPQLTTGTTGFPSPQWILMTRSGPPSPPLSASYNSSFANNAALTGSNFVVGRYSYIVYDTSGLLDANVAGYPSSSGTSASGKGLMPWADLAQLGSGISQTEVDTFVNWRNAATSANYAANVAISATNNGFTRVANGDTCFLGRQELIKYAQTQNPKLVSTLPYLTTFSRELNGPTWGPTTPAGSGTSYDYAALQYTSGALNPRIPNPRVKAAFIRNNGLDAVIGEPLVKYRFPLSKLALLEKFTGPGSGSLSATDIADIQKYFGLDLAPDANGPSYRHWNYPTTNPLYKHGVLSGSTGIMTLDDVALQNREPDFFELLQAGILSGSLGVPGTITKPGTPPTKTPNYGRGDQVPANLNGLDAFVDPDDISTLQTLRIGGNIIDQWDVDSYPTTITYNFSQDGLPFSISVYGIEDLPYPFAAFLNVYSAIANTPPFKFYIYFELWNPHQTPTVAGSGYPTNFRLSPLYNASLQDDSDYFRAGFWGNAVGTSVTTLGKWYYDGTTKLDRQFLGDPASNPPQITFSNNYREPALIPGTTAGAPAPLNTIACFTPRPLSNFPAAGVRANEDYLGAKFPAGFDSTKSGPWSVKVITSFVMPVQYQDAAGSWHTYGTFVGIDDPVNVDHPIGSFVNGTGNLLIGQVNIVSGSNISLNAVSWVKSDPRTFRLGTGWNNPPTNNANQALSTASGTMNNPVGSLPPFGISISTGVSPATPYRLDMWAANDNAVSLPTPHSTSSSYYSDNDGVQRWGDARNSYKFQNTSPLFSGKQANRPVMLNRPFQSVGDLGYAFRDMAWKTLDLFSANSADSGLLDLFTLSNAPMVAGRISPNTPYPQVLAALISGATQSTMGGTTVSSASALTTGAAIVQTTGTSGPFVNRADLVNHFMTNSAVTTTLAPSGIKTEAEAAVRAVAESSNTRTWNFLIDIIAQAGRFPPTAGNFDNFVVDGERRYWLHVAIDRYTGLVVDKQLEVVTE